MSQQKNIPKDYAERTGSEVDLDPPTPDTNGNKLFRRVLIVIMIFSFTAFLVQLIKSAMGGNC